jgi:mannose/fructose/N-acetylgalactosamine-specific phosphotransferase system component IIC
MIMSGIFGVLLGSILWMDRVFMFQFMVSRPMIMAPLIGLAMGDVKIGLFVGASLELLWLNATPVGAYLPNDESFCAAIAVPVAVTASVTMSDASAAGLAILLSMPFSFVGKSLDTYIRTINERLMPNTGEISERDVGSALRKALGRAFFYALISIGSCTLLLSAVAWLIRGYLSEIVHTALSIMPFACIVIGLAALVSKDIPRRLPTGMFVLGLALVLLLTWIL